MKKPSTTTSTEQAWGLEVTSFVKDNGPLTKQIALDADGKLISDGSACVMNGGRAERLRLTSSADLADLIRDMPSNRALALGRLRPDLPARVAIATVCRLRDGTAQAGAVSRTRDNLIYAAGQPALALLDFDRKGMPPDISEAIYARGGFWQILSGLLPGLHGVAWVRRASTSAGLIDQQTGKTVGGAGGEHVYVLVRDGTDIERFLNDLHNRCWLGGFGWFLIGSAGQLLERSIVDRMVGGPERLVFEGAPVLSPPLMQDAVARAPAWSAGQAFDTCAACPPLTVVQQARVSELKKAAAATLRPEMMHLRNTADELLARHIAESRSVSIEAARRVAEQRHCGVLLPDMELQFDDPNIGTISVADVLREPARFVDETLADPLEGINYGRCKAKLMQRRDGSLWVHSFAHGRTTYELMFDAALLEKVLEAADPASIVDTYAKLHPRAELLPDEESRISRKVAKRSDTFVQSLRHRLKQERDRRAAEHAEERASPSTLPQDRVRLPAPAPDSERMPVLRDLDEVLAEVSGPEPPMRNADGVVAEIHVRRPWGLHQLTETGVNAEQTASSYPAAPDEPLITPLKLVGLGLKIEHHVEYYRTTKEGERTVALHPSFGEAYLGWTAGRLPTVRAIVAAPVVTRSGGLLAGTGLDRRLELFFRIEPDVLDSVRLDPNTISDAEVVEAMHFLMDEWLCDVAAGFIGRLILIAYAMTLIERVALPERPAFFVTAGQRGGGKTTALTMAAAAVLGRRPPAAAWSPSAEERRKALLAHFSQGIATLVWDNVEQGTAISCPSIEKALTAVEFTDRELGSSRTVTVPSTTVMVFTGNNIAPKGDMASRSLICRLELDRPDPENRSFHHADPLQWTLSNRPRILRSLYLLLRWNPQVRAPQLEREPSKTRFKAWWDLVGAPLEFATTLAKEANERATHEGKPLFCCTPESADFGALFAAAEAEEEETCGMEELVCFLRSKFGTCLFSAADVVALLQPGGAAAGWQEADTLDSAQTLRAALEGATGKSLPPSVTAHAVGKRLQMILSRPVTLPGGETGMVVKARTGHAANTYRVEIMGEVG